MITLDQAKELVALLESGQDDEAQNLFNTLAVKSDEEIYLHVGQLTRQLHDSLSEFRLDSDRIDDLAKSEIPSARDHLKYVIERTEQAANKTMDAVEESMPLAENMNNNMSLVRPSWNRLMTGEIQFNEFKPLCYQIDELLTLVEGDSVKLRALMTEILMAQDFQDLTGQTIGKVIELVQEVEDELLGLLTVFGLDTLPESESEKETEEKEKASKMEASGPAINDSRDDVVSGQDDVDDLLSSLGF